jgi:hypothetical protein
MISSIGISTYLMSAYPQESNVCDNQYDICEKKEYCVVSVKSTAYQPMCIEKGKVYHAALFSKIEFFSAIITAFFLFKMLFKDEREDKQSKSLLMKK